MATDLLADLGINAEVLDTIEEQKAGGGKLIESGVFKFTIDKLFTRVTDKGAVMVHLNAHKSAAASEVLEYSTCIRSGDEKKNKTTYTAKNGKDVPLPGVTEIKYLMDALGVTSLSATPGKEKLGDKEIDVNAVLDAVGKELVLGIKIEEGEYPKNFIHSYMNTEGKNGKGEEIASKIAENIARNPIKKAKAQAAAAPIGGAGGSEQVAGW